MHRLGCASDPDLPLPRASAARPSTDSAKTDTRVGGSSPAASQTTPGQGPANVTASGGPSFRQTIVPLYSSSPTVPLTPGITTELDAVAAPARSLADLDPSITSQPQSPSATSGVENEMQSRAMDVPPPQETPRIQPSRTAQLPDTPSTSPLPEKTAPAPSGDTTAQAASTAATHPPAPASSLPESSNTAKTVMGGLKHALKIAKEVSGALPPLQAALGAVVASMEIYEVSAEFQMCDHERTSISWHCIEIQLQR